MKRNKEIRRRSWFRLDIVVEPLSENVWQAFGNVVLRPQCPMEIVLGVMELDNFLREIIRKGGEGKKPGEYFQARPTLRTVHLLPM